MDELRRVLGALSSEAQRRADVVEPWHSFWYHRPHLDFPPRSIRHVADLPSGSDRLSIACTQTELKPREQKQLVRDWCERLPLLTNIRFLWFQSRATQEMFDAACLMPALEGLYVKWSGIKSSRSIANARRLKYVHIGGSPSFEPVEIFAELPQLRWLELHNVRATTDLSFTRLLPELTGLSITGDTNSIKSIKLKTLEPLRALRNLEWLRLGTVTVDDESLSPIGEMPSLKHLLLSNRFRMEEIASLAGRLPHVQCDLFTPIGDPLDWTACKKCKQKTLVMLTGKGTPFLCTQCDAKRIQQHEDGFYRVAGAARASRNSKCLP